MTKKKTPVKVPGTKKAPPMKVPIPTKGPMKVPAKSKPAKPSKGY